MNPSSLILLHAFLSKWDPLQRAKLVECLPEEDKHTLEQLSHTPPPPLNYERFRFDWLLDFVHYSWLLPVLKSYAEESAYFLQGMKGDTKKRLEAKLKISSSSLRLSQVAERFFHQTLVQSLVGEQSTLLPPECLPESELNILCEFSKKELVDLIDYLSLYDLAAEVRQIVETKILKKIYSLLSEDQKNFMKTVMRQKEVPLPRLGLDRWDGTEEAFHQLLHRRGLTRMAIALSNQHPDLVWYVSHLLDKGRGSALSKTCRKEASHQLALHVTQNIMELVPLVHNR